MEQKYIVSARKYRPATFGTLVGQHALAETLKNSIAQDRLAQAYLFCGPRGVGKTSCARIFAKTINCLNRREDGEACGECESCRAFAEGGSYNIVELDAASNNSVDQIRLLNDQVRIAPQIGRYRVFIIDEVHMLSTAAFNAFLKTLEEPPAHVVFILATTEKQKILPTILSRCQIYDFNRIGINDIVEHLQYVSQSEGIQAEPAALNVIARKADGAMRDALSIFDQVAASSMNNITYQSTIANLNVLDYDYYFKLVDAFSAADVVEALLLYKQVRDAGFDSRFFIQGLGDHIRNLMVAKDSRTMPLLEAAADIAAQYQQQSAALPNKWFYRAMNLISECDLNYRNAGNKQFLVELALINLCHLNQTAQPEQTQAATSAPRPASAPKPATQSAQPTVAQQPRPAPTATPTAQPKQAAPQPRVAAPLPRNMVSRPASVRITPAGQAAQAPKTEDGSGSDSTDPHPAHSRTRRDQFTVEALHSAWHNFMMQNEKMVILVNTMRSALPEQIDAETYKVSVENPVQADEINNALPKLLPFLRQAIGNDMLALKVTLTKKTEQPKLLTREEVLQKIASSNPLINEMLQTWELSLSR